MVVWLPRSCPGTPATKLQVAFELPQLLTFSSEVEVPGLHDLVGLLEQKP